MNRFFADTAYFIALLNPDDGHHSVAVKLTQGAQFNLFTSEWILVELLDGLSRPPTRLTAIEFVKVLACSPHVQVVPWEQRTYQSAFLLYSQRPDKSWSFTDCTSFVIMQTLSLQDALTSDRHFQQAGFNALMIQ